MIDIADSAASRYRLTEIEWNFYEKPNVNPKFRGHYYKYVYMISKFLSPGKNAVVKVNTRTTEISQWVPDFNYLLDEVVFVPRPGSEDEEDGVLLVTGQNLNKNLGFVVVLDAETLEKLAEIGAPDATPPSAGHSDFYYFTELGIPSPLIGHAIQLNNNKHFILTAIFISLIIGVDW